MYSNLPTVVNTNILEVTSAAFRPYAFIPEQYTCDGLNEPPDLSINNIPFGTKCLAIIVDDPDGPIGTWTHWIAWNIAPKSIIKTSKIKGSQGINNFGMFKYCGPCPPNGIHHYHFKVYALDALLSDLNRNCTKHQLEKAISSHILAFGELIGLYKRNKK